MRGKRGQVTLFVIVAILFVAAIVLVSFFRGFGPFGLPSEIAPVEDQIINCIQENLENGLANLGEQGGYIIPPEFEAGNDYAPFTSQLNFFGSVMPYWFYLSASGSYKEQVPSIKSMEDQLEDYVAENLAFCDVEEFLQQGYVINFGEEADVKADIREGEVFVDVNWPVTIDFEGTSRRVTSHDVNVKSKFGKLYNLAREVYDREQNRLFLEDYTIDVLSLYVPGTDVEFTCSPKIWIKEEVKQDLLNGLEANIQTIKISGDYYDLSDDERKYYVEEIASDLKDEQINFFYDKLFPTKIEIEPSDGEIMQANPIGNQEGLGVLGFCYVPYHFIYTVTYPVVVQVFDEDFGLFQFPMIVSVENNQPRGAVPAEAVEENEVELCEFKVQEFSVRTTDSSGGSVDANIGFKCSNTYCSIGKTENGLLEGEFPQCVNGFIVAQKEGYIESRVQVSTNEGGSVEIFMRPKYDLEVRVLNNLVALEEDETAFVTFSSEDWSTSILYPTQEKVTLAEGNYEISAYLTKEGRIVLDAQVIERCVNVPKNGVFGFLGFEREECFNIDQPKQVLNQITIGGGNAEVFLSNDDLEDASFIGVEISSQPIPKSVFELQDIYTNIFASKIGITLR